MTQTGVPGLLLICPGPWIPPPSADGASMSTGETKESFYLTDTGKNRKNGCDRKDEAGEGAELEIRLM